MASASQQAPVLTRPETTDPSFSTTLAHGLDVLAAFRNGSGGSLSNADLAASTGLSRPTVSRLTYTLAQLGYLKRAAKGRFELGLGILAAAYPVLSALKVRQMARPLMRSAARPMKVMLEPRTWRVCGISPNGSTWTKGSPR